MCCKVIVMTMTMFHGTSSAGLPLHEGLCLAEDDERAWDYARCAFGDIRYVHRAELDLDGLTVLELDEGYQRDGNVAPADLDPAGFPGTDVIVFDDETPHGRYHVTYRLLTSRALAALTYVSTESEER
jgi:hypothetical protein